MMVWGDVFRGCFRNSFEKLEVFMFGKVIEVEFIMFDVGYIFKKGYCIMIQV